jgi:hypothetical protein
MKLMKLEKCHCGHPAMVLEDIPRIHFEIYCSNCDSGETRLTKEDEIRIWNKRQKAKNTILSWINDITRLKARGVRIKKEELKELIGLL